MGGKIGLESREGEGSLFWFTVKFERQDEARETEIKLDALSDLPHCRILLVDSGSENRQRLQKLLNSWGCLELASTGEGSAVPEELQRAARKGVPYDLLLLDLQTPGLDVDALVSSIRQDDGLRDTILAAMTWGGNRGEAARLADQGFAGYLTKPFDETTLKECLITLLAGRRKGVGARAGMVTRHSLADSRKQEVSILLVEDNRINQKVAVAILNRLGYKVEVAGNGVEALASLRTRTFDLILMDCEMPEMDGYEATRQIRLWEREQQKSKPGIVIVAMTAHAMPGSREKCLAAGMDDFISKPVSPENLAEITAKWLNHSTTRDQPSSPVSDSPQSQAPEATDGSSQPEVAAILEQRLNGDRGLGLRLIKIFLEDSPPKLSDLEKAITAGNLSEARRLAHALTGSAAVIGLQPMLLACRELESRCRNEELNPARLGLQKVKEIYAGLEEELCQLSAIWAETSSEPEGIA